jgi:hypothetical protein
MPVLVVHQVPSLTRERYDEVVRQLTGGKSPAESPSDFPFDGLLSHATAETENGFIVFDVFESQEAFDRFGEIVAPIARSVGIEEPAKAYPAHTFVQE